MSRCQENRGQTLLACYVHCALDGAMQMKIYMVPFFQGKSHSVAFIWFPFNGQNVGNERSNFQQI